MIYIHRGDDTDFNNSSFLAFNIVTEKDLTGWQATFVINDLEKTFSDISNKIFKLTLSAQETSKFKIGKTINQLKLIDENGKIKTVINNLDIYITEEVVDNETQIINLPILKDEGVDINIEVSNIPTKTSDLENDSNFLSVAITDPAKDQIIKFDGEKWINARQTGGGSGGSGTFDHSELDNRNKADQHEISAITNLQETLDGKADKSEIPNLDEYVTDDELENKGYLTEHQDISNLATKDELTNKQDTLISGTNIKTINNQSILGEGNITIEGDSGSGLDYDKSEISGWAMPSDKYVELTLGASGTNYTAPANGWFFLSAQATSTNSYILIGGSSCHVTAQSNAKGDINASIFPCKKGDSVFVNYADSTGSYFRFIYAEGEQ